MALSGMDFYMRSFKEYQEKGLAAYRDGEMKEARFSLLKAAEFLFKLAQGSDGQLAKKRSEQARKLLEKAKGIDPDAGPRSPKKPKLGTPGAVDKDGNAVDLEGRAAEGAERFQAVGTPNIKFDDIAGLEKVKDEIRIKMIYPFTHPEAAEKFKIKQGGGVLLFGPPGTGKTMLAKAVAGEIEAAFFNVKPADIMETLVGEAEKNIARLFAVARTNERSIIFFDEVEALAPARTDQGSAVMQRVVPQILAELDGFDSHEKNPVLFLGATNKPWQLDPAIMRPGRFDERVYVSLPDRPARKKILELNLVDRPLAADVDVGELADRLDGYSGADLKEICENAAQKAFRRIVAGGGSGPITAADFDAIVAESVPTVRPNQLEPFERFARGE